MILYVAGINIVNAQSYSITNLNVEDGLPQSSVKDITKDKYGFIWISTESGIVRFDGQNFVNPEVKGLNNRFGDFFGEVDKDLIFSLNDGEKNMLLINKRNLKEIKKTFSFSRYRRQTKFLFYVKNSLGSNVNSEVGHFLKTKNGFYYILNDGIEYINSEKRIFKYRTGINHKNLNNLFGIDGKIFFLNKENNKMFQLSDKIFSEIKCDKILKDKEANFFWSSINNQSFLYLKNSLYSIYLDNNVVKVHKIVNFDKADINLNFSSSIFYDKLNNKLYIGSLVKGLYVINFNEFKVIQDKRSPHLNSFYSLLPLGNTILSPTGNIYSIDGKREQLKLKGKSDKYSFIFDNRKNLLYKQDGKLYIANFFSQYQTVREIQFGYYISFLGYGNNMCMISFENDKGILNLYLNNQFNKPFRTFFTNEEIKFAKFYTHDSLLIADRRVLYRASIKTGKLSIVSKNIPNIRNIFISRDNRVWILTYGNGFFLLDNNRLLKLPLDYYKYLSEVHTIIEDNHGFFWITTNHGLFQIKESELLKFVNSKKYIPHYYLFNKSDGFITNEFNGGANPVGITLHNKLIVLPTLEGMVIFNPKDIHAYYPSRNYFVETAIVDNNKRYFSDKLILERNFSRVTLVVDVPYYGNISNLLVQAKFNNQTAIWENIGQNRKFTFTNLPHGKYELLFRILISSEGVYSYKRVLIIVKPYFYETWMFKILIIILFSLFIFIIYKLRVSYLEKMNDVLENVIKQRTSALNKIVLDLQNTKTKLENESLQQKKLIGTISHDITTPIKYLALTAEMLYEANDDDIKLKKSYLFNLNKYALQLFKFTQTLKEYSEIYRDNKTYDNISYPLNEILDNKISLFNDIARYNNSKIINHVSQDVTTNISKNILSIIIHNILDNAVKYTQNGNIYINFYYTNSANILEIQDEGIGMSKEKINYYTFLQTNSQDEKLLLQKYGLGLHLVLQLTKMIGAKIVIELNQPRGTSIKILLI
ncbi:HAMP domain-containing sensor histidine kinase [Chryseobacterium sp. SG20098]|uniref:sensor histidine kinase n=1 Tax=Chryseobacterium sp. SG20098 TaxID=3074145 RepID=UPI002883046E|nr:HAMP domain-containing sensor histidine kinase [Chryseobacterium sp. SG20098]WNI36457.1 HAMP domain-containing sensor histidine kinase [Chryseobacterium sp. SG20098]